MVDEIPQHSEVFQSLLIMLGLSVAIVWGLRKINLPPILGYLIAGALIGPDALKVFTDLGQIEFLAEFGVVFLLFTIGLELSFPKLISMRRSLLGLGGMQVLLCSLIAIGACLALDIRLDSSIAIAGAFALSSTAVVIKQLVEQDEMHLSHGRVILSILLFQDLAAVPFLIIVPAMAAGTDVTLSESLISAGIKGGLVFIAMAAAGRWILRPMFHYIAHARSSELFMLTTLLVVLLSAYITEHLGLSAPLGAFLAGVMLAETEYVHQIESDILPFRDILLGLFFITVGMRLSPEVFIDKWDVILLILLALTVVKFVIISSLALIAKSDKRTAVKSGLSLAQGGEFGFALLSVALSHHVVDNDTAGIVIATIILSIAIAPLLMRNSDRICDLLFKEPEDTIACSDKITNQGEQDYNDHVIICGYGRVGQTLAKFLEFEGIPYVALDLDPFRLKEAKAASEPVFFGDVLQEKVLHAVGIEKARMLILSFDNPKIALKALAIIRKHHKQLPILIRTKDDRYLDELTNAGASEVIPDKLESSLMMAAHMLIFLGTPPEKAHQNIWEVKSNRYKMLKGYFHGSSDQAHVEDIECSDEQLHTVVLTESAYACGKTLKQLQEDSTIQIASFTRNGFKSAYPEPNELLMPQDILVLQGTLEEVYLAEEKLLQG